MSTETKKQPIKRFRNSGVSIAIWEYEHDGTVYYTTTVDRSDRDRDGEWQRTNRFDQGDLATLHRVTAKAEAFLDELKSQ